MMRSALSAPKAGGSHPKKMSNFQPLWGAISRVMAGLNTAIPCVWLIFSFDFTLIRCSPASLRSITNETSQRYAVVIFP